MVSLIKWVIAPVFAVVFLVGANTQSAKAQFGISIGIGNYGYGHHHHAGHYSHGPSLGYGSPVYSPYGAGYGGYGASSYSRGAYYGSSSYGYPSVRSSFYGSPGVSVYRAAPVVIAPSPYGFAPRRCY